MTNNADIKYDIDIPLFGVTNVVLSGENKECTSKGGFVNQNDRLCYFYYVKIF
jgi:hypothetical protein